MATRFNTLSIDVMVSDMKDPARVSAALARAAKEGVAELIETGQASPAYQRFVDGREGVPEEAVRADGTILYSFNYLGEIAAFALAFLRNRSPVDRGEYRESFFFAIDGRFVPSGQVDFDTIPPTAEIIIGNTQPYNRKVDVQFVGTEPLRFSVPPNLFDDAARAVKRQYGKIATAKRVASVNFPGQWTLRHRKLEGAWRRRWRDIRATGGQVQSPAIVIRLKG